MHRPSSGQPRLEQSGPAVLGRLAKNNTNEVIEGTVAVRPYSQYERRPSSNQTVASCRPQKQHTSCQFGRSADWAVSSVGVAWQYLECDEPVDDEVAHCFASAATVDIFREHTENTVAIRPYWQYEPRQ